MIVEALSFLATELGEHLSAAFSTVERKALLTALHTPDGAVPTGLLNTIGVSFLNLELTRSNAVLPFRQPTRPALAGPSLRLRMLVSSHFSDYAEALKFLGSAFQFFHEHPVFTQAGFPRMDRQFEQLLVDLEPTSTEEWSNVWRMVGAPSTPALIYRVRLLTAESPAPAVEQGIAVR